MKREMTCIICPMGCRLTADEGEGGIEITGNTCKRGEIYAVTEMKNPVRVLTSTVKIKSEEYVVLPVKTDKPIKKNDLFKAMKKISQIEVTPPIYIGDIIASDFMGNGINLVATKTVKK